VNGISRIRLICGPSRGSGDGIRDYSDCLAAALREAGVHADVVAGPSQAREADPSDVMLLQYNPFSFARWGLAPHLIARMRQWRAQEALTGLILHERAIPIGTVRDLPIGAWQRLQLRALIAHSSVCFRTSEEPDEHPRLAQAPLLPVGSNLPDRRADRDEQRAKLQVDENQTVLATFGQRHPGRLLDRVQLACERVARATGPVVLLNLGAKPPEFGPIEGTSVVSPGPLEASALAGHIAASDVLLLPYDDGISTRRTTVMAALQHSRAIVGVEGRLTNTTLWRDSIALTSIADPESFAAEALRLVEDGDARRELGERGRQLYEERFDWAVIGRSLLAEVDGRRSGASRTDGLSSPIAL
jgi:glycosyltransferase involved in cell wall biosynthesis